jgi:prepilin-type N-terminal cleavage/methylation domain-containing protein
MIFCINTFKNIKIKNRGFSLMEMLVTVTIFTIMMGLTFFNYPKLAQSLSFSNSAQEITGSLKTAQVNGSSRGGDYTGDGVYYEKGKSYYTEFKDATTTIDSFGTKRGDNLFSILTTPSDSEKKVEIGNVIIIGDICVKNSVDSSKVCGKNKLSITFSRPAVVANITDHSQTSSVNNFYDKGYIELYKAGYAGFDRKCVIVYKYGDIDLKNTPCADQP